MSAEPVLAAWLADEKGNQTDGFTDSTENSEEPTKILGILAS
jgi:hypothetical protein